MRERPYLTPGLLAFLGLMAASGDVPAGGVVVCNNCTSVTRAARQGGSGIVIVSDFSRGQLWGFRNEFDRGTGEHLPLPAAIPAPIRHSHALTLAAAAGAQADLVLRQGDPSGNAFPFPDGFDGWTAHDVATDNRMRVRFGQALAAAYAGAITSSAAWNDLAMSLKSLALNWLAGHHAITQVTLAVHWRDGSTSPMAIRRGRSARATLLPVPRAAPQRSPHAKHAVPPTLEPRRPPTGRRHGMPG